MELTMFNQIVKKLSVPVLMLTLTLISSSAFAGGTTGGGGNVQESEQVSENYLIRSVEMAKPIVRVWLNKRFINYASLKRLDLCAEENRKADCAIDAKLFDGKKTIFQVIDDLEIETKLNEPCLDFEKKPNDGSIFGRNAGSICISISNIKRKLRAENYQNQVTALVLHEVSHLMGTNEVEAERLQWLMLIMDLAYMPVQTLEVNIGMAEGDLRAFSSNLSSWASIMKTKTSMNGMCIQTEQMMNQYYELNRQAIDLSSYILLNPEHYSLFWGDFIKIRAFWNYVCGQDQTVDPANREMHGSVYEFYFHNKTQVTAVEFGGGFSDLASPKVLLNKITSKTIFDSEVDGIAKLFQEIPSWYSNSFVNEDFVTYQTKK